MASKTTDTKPPLVAMMADRHRRLRQGCPWAYSNEIVMTPAAKAITPGSVVRLEDAQGAPLGLFWFNPRTLIAARRLTTRIDAPIDQAFFNDRLAAALRLRERMIGQPYYRLIHAEADGLPGLIIDRFGEDVTVQMNAAGADASREMLLAAIETVLAPKRILLRNDSGIRTLEGLPEEVEWVKGGPGPTILEENGVRFEVDLAAGQKTGWFYDQRDNHAAVASLSAGARVLDVYCYAGGFGIEALAAGAAHCTFLDRSNAALAAVERAAALNGIDPERVRTIGGDGAYVMERMAEDGDQFDVVVCDPPAFVKSRKDLGIGLKAYRRVARTAARLVAPGGLLFLASCSHNVEVEAFAAECRGGVARAGRNGRILRSAGAAPDHPIHPFLPESAYLKTLLFQLD